MSCINKVKKDSATLKSHFFMRCYFVCMSSPVIAIPAAFKLIKDAVILVQRAQFAPQVLMNLERSEAGGKGLP